MIKEIAYLSGKQVQPKRAHGKQPYTEKNAPATLLSQDKKATPPMAMAAPASTAYTKDVNGFIRSPSPKLFPIFTMFSGRGR